MHYIPVKESKNSLFDAIRRGRHALSQAENHIQIFEEFLSQSNVCQENTNGIVASLINVEKSGQYKGSHQETNHNELPDDSIFEIPESVDFLDRLMKVRKDEIEKTVTKLKSESTRLTHNVTAKQTENQNTNKKKKRRSFDPTRLYKDRKQRECLTNEQSNEQEFSQFKALPLPGGANVSNDPYALTKAAQSKMLKKQTDDNIHHNAKRYDASLLLNGDTDYASFNNGSQANSFKRKNEIDEIYKAATEYVKSTFATDRDDTDEEDDVMLSYENIETVKGLQMEIARLKAQLRCKKMKCIETIQELGQEVQYKNVDEFLGVAVKCDNSKEGDILHDIQDKKNDKQYESLYERQQEWNKNRIDKVQSIRETAERNILEAMTSKPQIQYGKKSWLDSKAAHDKLMHEANEREIQLQIEREEKERITQNRRLEESENILRLAKEKARSLKQNVDKNHQLEYVDRLSRSVRREKNVSIDTVKDKVSTRHDDSTRNEKETKSPFLSDKKKISEKPKSFAEMDDQEFAQMIKEIQVQAKKKFRNEAKNHQRKIGTDVDLKTLERKVNHSPYR